MGFKVDWIDMKRAGRAGHIVARHKGNGRGKRMLLIGHLDTVFEPDLRSSDGSARATAESVRAPGTTRAGWR